MEVNEVDRLLDRAGMSLIITLRCFISAPVWRKLL